MNRFYRELVRITASFFYVGYFPVASGAMGSAAAFVLIAPLDSKTLAFVTAVLSVVGIAICGASQVVFQKPDPSEYVLDEVCGMALSVLWLPADWGVWITAYVIFRVLDVFKPWPIIIFQKMRHPAGIMLDDLAAGAITNLILQMLIFGMRLA